MSTEAPRSGPSGEPSRKGSAKSAKQIPDAGVSPEQAAPPQQMRQPLVPRNVSNQTNWPLPDSGLPSHPINQHPRYKVPRGPLPQGPLHPSEVPSPSISSGQNGPVLEKSSTPSQRPPHSFSQLQPPPLAQLRQPTNDTDASPTSTSDKTPRISIEAVDLPQQSVTSSMPSVHDAPRFPPTFLQPESSPSQDDPRHQAAGLVVPLNARRPGLDPQSSIPTITEEFADSRFTKCSVASSRAIPLSWGSDPAESEIRGEYLDIDSDDGQLSPGFQDDEVRLVRNASVGKRANPHPGGIRQGHSNSFSTTSSESLCGLDPEKPPLAPHDDPPSDARLEKELEAFELLGHAAPAMSDKRPGGHKPPALNLHALRDAEARGSLSSLSDLIRRATKLASNLDHGRTASKTTLAGGEGAGFKGGLGHRPQNSGSLSDMLASFPPPGLATPKNRGSGTSWPSFGHSNLRNVEQVHSHEDDPNLSHPRALCCGMPRKVFVIICIVIFIIVVLAVLLPVFLVAVPREASSCAEKNPCANGGVSVSAGPQCSCICTNGYTGSQCTTASDGSCTTSLISNGANATMGSALPTLFEESKKKFDITLDSVTIMALFSINNVSCKAENALVTFGEVTSDDTSKTRRSVHLIDDSTPSVSNDPTPVLADRSEATMNGILYDDTESSKSATTMPTPIQTGSGTTATATKISVQSTAMKPSESVPTVPSVPGNVVGFSRVAVLYILQKTGSLETALASEVDIQEYLVYSYANTTQPAMMVGEFDVDFENLTITLPNSTVHAQ
ncbi:EGF-like, type 3 [Penicillium digitatum]|uniref:EGF-like, type 3 n=1 Tax=Penicillium digitatum TaxID=36651 RepID=A0A7T7BQ73_PENDI|nr:EGF-like, type 3 [Penicillium digitatum]